MKNKDPPSLKLSRQFKYFFINILHPNRVCNPDIPMKSFPFVCLACFHMPRLSTQRNQKEFLICKMPANKIQNSKRWIFKLIFHLPLFFEDPSGNSYLRIFSFFHPIDIYCQEQIAKIMNLLTNRRHAVEGQKMSLSFLLFVSKKKLNEQE